MINWQGIDFPAGIKEWKRFEKINETVALDIYILRMHINLNVIIHARFVNDY